MKIKHKCKKCAKWSNRYAKWSKDCPKWSNRYAKWSKEYAEKCQCGGEVK